MDLPITVGDAVARVLARAPMARVVECPLEKATGRVLRAPLRADRPLPPFDRMMMDGYAVRLVDAVPGRRLRVCGEAAAGEPQKVLPEGDALVLEAMTGAPLPAGADLVIPYEEVEAREAGIVEVKAGFEAGAGLYVHRIGSDYAAGSVLLEEGTVLGPVEAGIAASCGYASVPISQSPRIALLGTGDELVPVRSQPEPHQIRRSNVAAMENALALAGFACGVQGHLNDEPGAGREALIRVLAEADVVVICGAVSRGVRDWVPAALDALGEKQFHGVAQRPGKPMGFWVMPGGCVVFALPGNPVSALVGLHRYVLPWLRKRQGLPEQPARRVLAAPVENRLKLTWFVPVSMGSDGRVQPCPVNNSGDYARLANTDGFIELGAEQHYTEGTEVIYFPWQS